MRDEWIKDWKSGNLDGIRKLYATDAVFQPALGAEIQGRDAIVDYLKRINDETKGELFVVPDGLGEVSGDIAYDSGFMHYWIEKTVAPIKGSYLMVLKRDSDGNWQIVRHAFAGIAVRYPNQSEAVQCPDIAFREYYRQPGSNSKNALNQGQVVARSQKASVPTALAGASHRTAPRLHTPPTEKTIPKSERTIPRRMNW